MLLVAGARSSSDHNNAIFLYIAVLWMTPYYHAVVRRYSDSAAMVID